MIYRFPLCTAIGNDHLVIFCEIGDLVDKVIDRSAITMNDKQRLAFTINLIIHFKPADVGIFANRVVFSVMGSIDVFIWILGKAYLYKQCKSKNQSEF